MQRASILVVLLCSVAASAWRHRRFLSEQTVSDKRVIEAHIAAAGAVASHNISNGSRERVSIAPMPTSIPDPPKIGYYRYGLDLWPQHLPGVHMVGGRASRNLQSPEVALADPILKAAVASQSIPTWVRGMLVTCFLAMLAAIYVLSMIEEAEIRAVGVMTPREDEIVKASASPVNVGPRLPALEEAVAKRLNVSIMVKTAAKPHLTKVAAVDADGQPYFTYSELISNVEALARALRAAGMQRGDIVATLLKTSSTLVVATLGIMDASMVWAPLDVDAPAAWRFQQVGFMGGRLQLCSHDRIFDFLAEHSGVPIWGLDDKGRLLEDFFGPVPKPSLKQPVPQDACLIIHTSGSTGKPKAVLYETRFVLHSLLTFINDLQMDSTSIGLLKTPSTWAVVEWEIFCPLLVGGSMVVDWRCQRTWPLLAQVLRERKVSTLVTSAPVLQLLLDDYWRDDPSTRPPKLRQLLNVGAGIPLRLCDAICKTLGAGTTVHNNYAASETSSLHYHVSAGDDVPAAAAMRPTPAGVPDCHVEVYLCDADLKQVPPGQKGEICIAGEYLAMGYLGDYENTAKKFLINPYGRGRLYRTGDLGYWAPDPVRPDKSVIQVCGRVDRQTNIRGMRVSPEDVEVVIRGVPDVSDTAVIVGKADGHRACLVACIEPTAESDSNLENPVKQHCLAQLPKHMQPEMIIQYPSLPVLANGKIDLVKLSEDASKAIATSERSAPDSLGIARSVRREVVRELDIMSAARGVAILPVVLFHWYYMPIAWYDPQTVTRQFPFPSVLFINICIGMNWPMQLFVLTSGFQDRGAVDQRRAGEWRGDLFVLLLLVLSHEPMLEVLDVFCWIRHGFQEPFTTYETLPGTGVRWYLYFYLVCRALSFWVFAPFLDLLQWHGSEIRDRELSVATGSTVIVLLFWAIAWLGETKTVDGQLWWEVPNVCVGLAQKDTLVWATEFLLPQGPGTNHPGSDNPAYCGLFDHQTFLWYLAAYAAAWWYSRAVVRWCQAHAPKVYFWIALPCFLVIVYLFYNVEQFQLMTAWEEPDAGTWMLNYLIDMCLASCCLYTLATCPDSVLSYSGLVFMGRYSLGTYLVHNYLFGPSGFMSAANPRAFVHVPEVATTIGAVETWPGSSFGLPQLGILVGYALAVMLTLGPLFQVATVTVYSKLLSKLA